VLFRIAEELQVQLKTFLFAYGYLISMPFIILDAQANIVLDGVAIGTLITMQMSGAMLSNILWGLLSSKGLNKQTAHLAILFQISAIVLALFSHSLYLYMLIFFFLGAGADGNRIASGNLLLELAPAKKRPVYVALQMNILAFGMFFSMIGGLLLQFFSYHVLYYCTIAVLLTAFFYSFKLKKSVA
jgi:MFS family permease